MTQPVAVQSYTQATGSSSNTVFITIFLPRSPNANDVQYPVAKRWVNTVTFKEYILTGFSTAGGVTQAIWINLTNGIVGSLEELSGNSGTNPVLPDSDSNINILGDSTSINISGSTNTLTANVVLPVEDNVVLLGHTNSIGAVADGTTDGQVLTYSTTGAPTWQNSAAGLTVGPFGASPNDNGATISSGILTLEPASATEPGGVTASGTQVWGGVKSFSNAPIVPLVGLLIGNGPSAISATTLTPNAALVASNGNDILSIPLTSGQFVIGNTGGIPAAGTITAGMGISVTPLANGITVSSTATGFAWNQENAGNFQSVEGNGYIVNVATPAATTLPVSPNLGDTISYIANIANILTINAPTATVILIGNAQSSSAGKAVNSAKGDSITLVYIGSGTWASLGAPQGVWLLS